MAKEDNKKALSNELEKLSADSHILVYGTDNSLTSEDSTTNDIISQTIVATKEKFGIKTGGKPINYFNEVNIGSIFSEVTGGKKKEKQTKDAETRAFKEYMINNNQVDPMSLLYSDTGRLIQFENYRTIFNHITECAQALEVYKDNIMSPDDFTKLIFNIQYEGPSDKINVTVENDLKDLVEKYELEEKADKIIEDTLKLGENYLAILPLDNEIEMLLKSSSPSGILNESQIRLLDKDISNTMILTESVTLNEDEKEALTELFDFKTNEEKEKVNLQEFVARTINDNVTLGSVGELLTERYEYEKNTHDLSLKDIPGATIKEKRTKKKKEDESQLYLNGSVLKMLDPSRTVELKVDNICYGYYYVEEIGNPITNSPYLGVSSGREARQGTGINMGLNNNLPGTSKYTPMSSSASALNTTDEKLKVISKIFIDKLATKVDKKWIRENKKFKEFIYELLRQDYIIKKGIKMTYFTPDEVVKFEVPALYRKIVFAAKLYLSAMTNDILIKMGRAHDKRVFYVNVGLDANYEQAVNKVIEDIKRREYRMDNLNDFNSILNLNPGRWDDYFIPTVNGDRPIEIDTLAGMDTDLNSEFLNYLKNTMMAGIGVPTNLIDNMNDITFARSLSAQNANFVRDVIRYQKLFTKPFTKALQKLYSNEYKYSNEKEKDTSPIDSSKIIVSFPSPASLNMSNISEQIQTADSNAEFISSQLIRPKLDGSTDEQRLALKSKILQDLLPSIDWDKYKKLKDETLLEVKKEKLAEPVADPNGMTPGMDPYEQTPAGF